MLRQHTAPMAIPQTHAFGRCQCGHHACSLSSRLWFAYAASLALGQSHLQAVFGTDLRASARVVFHLSCPLLADGSYFFFLSQPAARRRVLSLCDEHRPLLADGSVSCGVWERATRCSQTGRSRVYHVRACVSWWCMCVMLLSRSRVWSAENLVWFYTFF